MRSLSAPAVEGQGSDASMRHRFTVLRRTTTDSMPVRSALGGFKAVIGSWGAFAEVIGHISPGALAGVDRGKSAGSAALVALAVRHILVTGPSAPGPGSGYCQRVLPFGPPFRGRPCFASGRAAR